MPDRVRPAALLFAAFAVLAVVDARAYDNAEAGRAEPEQKDRSAQSSLKITFSPCEFTSRDGRKVAIERGEFYVPENRNDPKSRRIKLGFARFPATTPNEGPPLVYLAGGPGGAGTEAARVPARFAMFMALREMGDVIALDQRGTGWSNDVPVCPTSMALPLDKPLTRPALISELQSTARECARFWKDAGIDLAGYNTAESADDIEALREALGVPKISLWGISYGSHLAFAVLKRHPRSIERVALVGLEGLDETVKLPALTDAYFARLQAAIVLRKPGALQFRGMPEAMDAASGISADRLRLVEQQARTSLLGDVLNFPIPHVGDAFGVPDLGEEFRAPVSSSVPTLFLSGTLDGRTYPESAREIAARFPNATHVIVENGGHNLFEASPLIKDMIVAFMKGQEPASTTLKLDPPKFVE